MSATIPSHLRPNLIGIGAAKSGTTFFAGVLSRHPDIFVSPQKELNALYYDDFDDRVDEYMEHFRRSQDERIRCDFSVRYLSEPNAPATASRIAPDAKLIAILRDPVDQVQSHYWHQRRQNFSQPYPVTPAPDLFEAIERFPHLLLEPALYDKHLQRWRAFFPPENFFLIDFADLARDLDGILSRLCPFLGIPSFNVPIPPVNKTRDSRMGVAPRSDLLGKVYPVLYASVAHGPYQSLKHLLGVRRVETLKRRLRLRETAEAIFFAKSYPKLGEQERRRLADVFASDVTALVSSGFTPASSWTKP